MASGRIRKTARRGIAAAVLAWLSVGVAAVLFAPGAAAASEVPITIRDLTPPLASVDAGGTVIFTNGIQDKTLQVGGGGLLPSLVTVVVHTDVTLRMPSGTYALQPGQQVREKFAQSCLTCTITYTYRTTVPDTSLVGAVLNTVTSNALKLLPQNQVVNYNNKQTTVQIGVPTPFIVNTLIPLPNLPSVNLPQLPPVTVTVPTLPGGTPSTGPVTPPAAGVPATQPTPTATASGIAGAPYAYNTGAGVPQLSPSDVVAAAAFDPSRYYVPGRSLGGVDRAGAGGSGGVPGSYDGASVPVFGQLAGLDDAALDDEAASTATASDSSPAAQALPAAALAAVVALAAVTAALVRTHQASRATR